MMVTRRILSGAGSALAGLLVVIVTGMVSWSLGSGIVGIVIGMTFGGVAASLLRRLTQWPASVLAGCIGGGVASYAAIATAEVLPPGSAEWATKGGFYGASIGGLVGGVLGLLARTRSEGRPGDADVRK